MRKPGVADRSNYQTLRVSERKRALWAVVGNSFDLSKISSLHRRQLDGKLSHIAELSGLEQSHIQSALAQANRILPATLKLERTPPVIAGAVKAGRTSKARRPLLNEYKQIFDEISSAQSGHEAVKRLAYFAHFQARQPVPSLDAFRAIVDSALLRKNASYHPQTGPEYAAARYFYGGLQSAVLRLQRAGLPVEKTAGLPELSQWLQGIHLQSIANRRPIEPAKKTS
jgi:hypothetical protein